MSWVVGTVEIASILANFARAVPDSYSVALSSHRFYDFSYDFQIASGRGDWLRRRFAAPWEFGRLAAVAQGFVYIGAEGFLLSGDDREWEFGFLRRHGVRVACVFTGSDIRSPALMRRYQEETGRETIVTYLDQVSAVFSSPAYDDKRRRVAAVADQHADVIFTAAVDQLSYLQRETEPFPYFFPDDDLLTDAAKHAAAGPRIVLHVPSSPIIKGTQVVRAAVRRLHEEGYAFEYRELLDVPHADVLAAVRDAHIVLNEFYAFVPGVFGVEAMASNCALLTRADQSIETDLPEGSNAAWMVTTAADILANLRELLDHPERIAPQAAAGLAWVQEHATVSASGARVRGVLDGVAALRGD
ncbi:hypothetical protein BH11ACT3_BH11ACT3_06690 [soil metagenome]